ncbi:MAG: phosphopyruvate hydratase [Alphaproteobacteria bacterium]
MSDSEIVAVHARRVWDSRGRPTVEAEVRLAGGARGRAIAPAGASTGSGEAVDLRDGGMRHGGLDVGRAIESVNGEIARALLGANAADQWTVDGRLIRLDGRPDKSRLGANACVAVSMAAAHAAAQAAGVPLYRHLGGTSPSLLPLPQVQIFGGGAHAAGRTDVQDFLIVCPAAGSFAEALEWTAEVYRVAGTIMSETGRLAGVADEGGYWPSFDSNEQALAALTDAIARAGFTPGLEVAIALDVAASQFGRGGAYRLALDRRELDTAGMVEMISGWVNRFPIISLEDPLAEDDSPGFVALTAAIGDRTQIVGDDLLVSDAARIRAAAHDGAANAVLLKPNQRGTLSETWTAWDAARKFGWRGIVSARSGDSEDVTIAHLAVGWEVGQIKVGSFARSERMAKWNELLRIEEELGADARFAGAAALTAA